MRHAVVIAAMSMIAAACGSDDTTGGATTTAPASEAPVTTLESGTLQVASCLDYAPFEYFEGDTLKGFDVELTEAIAAELGLKVEWVKANFDTIFTALAADKFDLVAAASTITPEREQVVDFSDPYYASRQALTVNTTETPDITSTDDLGADDTVGVQKGTTGQAWAKENLEPNGVELKVFDLAPDIFTALEAAQVTGIINDEPASAAEIENRADLEVVEAIDTNENYGLAISKSNPDLLAAVNEALAAVIADGTYASIFATYFPGVEVPPQFQAAA